MEHEAVKLVLWPRPPMEQESETVYRYLVLGIVCTTEPIDWPDESVVLSGHHNTELTKILNSMEKLKPPHNLGNATSAMLTVVDLEPWQCESEDEE